MFGYEPLPGSIPDRIIRHLRMQPPGTELATAVLADLVGQPASTMCAILKPARDHGVLQARRLPNQGNNLFWSLAQPPQHDAPAAATEPAAPPQAKDACQTSRGFCCALFSDGRLVLEAPGQSMTLEPDHTRELVRYLERMGGES